MKKKSKASVVKFVMAFAAVLAVGIGLIEALGHSMTRYADCCW